MTGGTYVRKVHTLRGHPRRIRQKRRPPPPKVERRRGKKMSNTEEPQDRIQRTTKLAVASLIVAVAALCAVFLLIAFDVRDPPLWFKVLAITTGVCWLAVPILAGIALSKIIRSRGRLKGYSFAIAGLGLWWVAPVLLLLGGMLCL